MCNSGGGGELYYEFSAEEMRNMATMFGNPASGLFRENNEDTSIGGGFKTKFEMTLGFGALAGTEVEAE